LDEQTEIIEQRAYTDLNPEGAISKHSGLSCVAHRCGLPVAGRPAECKPVAAIVERQGAQCDLNVRSASIVSVGTEIQNGPTTHARSDLPPAREHRNLRSAGAAGIPGIVRMIRRFTTIACLLVGCFASGAYAQETPTAPKVLVVTMFAGEAKPWLEHEALTRTISVPGLSKAFPTIGCTEQGLCVATTGKGYANAASSISAIVYSGKFDLRKTYFVISGIAGVDPAKGTLGSALWARWAIDGGLQNEIDAREMPDGWSAGYLAIGAAGPGQKGKLSYGDEVFRLNEVLLQSAFRLTRQVELVDSDAAKAYRARYPAAPAAEPPAV
jgi:hypothetical protein